MKSNDSALTKLFKVLVVFLAELIIAFGLVWLFDILEIYGIFLYAFYFFEVLIINLLGGIMIYKVIKDTRSLRFIIALIATIISFPLIWALSTEMITKFLFK